MDFFLPENSRHLFLRTRIINPWPKSLPMYWWSNVAVVETPDVRVIGPATEAVRHAYDGNLVKHDLPISEGMDVSYPGKRPYVRDLYFRIQEGQRPWITSLDANGYGLVQTSTDRLRGRKVFNWGLAGGGRHWQDFLSLPGKGAYIETQAGLAPTQSEYVRMPANTAWDWIEAYGPLQVEPSRAHAPDWPSAIAAVETQLESVLPRHQINQLYKDTQSLSDQPPEKILQTASGWGALERKRREKFNQPMPAQNALPFPDSTLGADQKPWLTLLETGALPERKPSELPLSPIVQPEWRDLVEKSLTTEKGNHWLAWYQVGIMRFAGGGAADFDGAAKAWETSIEKAPNAWAYRNLAVLAKKNNKLAKAAQLMENAWDLQPKSIPLTIELAKALAAADRHADVVRLIISLPADMQENKRLRLFHAQAALDTNDLETVGKFFEQVNEIPNMREKEVSLTTLWFDYHAKRVAAIEKIPIDAALQKRVRRENHPPSWIDFRASKDD
jgi:hypothetical protein